MLKSALISTGLALTASTAAAADRPALPPGFESRSVETQGAKLFVQVGGTGSPVVLLHGNVESGDMWGPLAAALQGHHTVIVPDLRGMGRSSHPAEGYEKAAQARDIRTVIETLGFDQAILVGHDIGSMVAYAYAAQYPTKVSRLVVMEAPLPGIPPWEDIKAMPVLWHFHFRGPDVERLVKGRERIYFDHFWNDFSADPGKISDATRNHYAAQYARDGGMHASFLQFAAFETDAREIPILARNRLTIPVLAIGGEKGFGAAMAATMRNVASDVREAVIPGVGHWLIEENPHATVTLVRDFIEAR